MGRGEKQYVASREKDTDKLEDENEKEQLSERRVGAVAKALCGSRQGGQDAVAR
jgi:hypothetical protein